MEAGQAVDILRRVRHDFANHLQVIGGYLDMGRPEKVKEYLAEIMEEIIAERLIFESQEGEAALYFYEQLARARDLGIILRYEDLDIESWEILKAKGQPCRSLGELSREEAKNDEELPVYLSIYEEETGIDLLFSCAAWMQSQKRVRVNKE